MSGVGSLSTLASGQDPSQVGFAWSNHLHTEHLTGPLWPFRNISCVCSVAFLELDSYVVWEVSFLERTGNFCPFHSWTVFLS